MEERVRRGGMVRRGARNSQERREDQCGKEGQERREARHTIGNTVYQGTYSRKGNSPSPLSQSRSCGWSKQNSLFCARWV